MNSEKAPHYKPENREQLLTRAVQTLEARGCQVYKVPDLDELIKIMTGIVGSDMIVVQPDPMLKKLSIIEKLRAEGVGVLSIDERQQPGTTQDILSQAIHREIASTAYGLTGVQAIVANHGSLMLIDDQGSLHSISSLPYAHLAIAGIEQIVEDLPEAMAVARKYSFAQTGKKLARYISLITGPSSTSDIEGKNVRGMHGPKEVKVFLIINKID